MGNELISPNLMPDQTMTGERLGKLFTQRTVWLIPNKKVTFSPFLLSNMFYLLLVLLTFNIDSKKNYSHHLQGFTMVIFVVGGTNIIMLSSYMYSNVNVTVRINKELHPLQKCY